mmetsp:Transcript_5238/g.14856  ORF Transcript_5238/g.14856 Transcript_5238/m.14856 type:complete len:445 (-) Transcript_5238:290-1624(-)
MHSSSPEGVHPACASALAGKDICVLFWELRTCRSDSFHETYPCYPSWPFCFHFCWNWQVQRYYLLQQTQTKHRRRRCHRHRRGHHQYQVHFQALRKATMHRAHPAWQWQHRDASWSPEGGLRGNSHRDADCHVHHTRLDSASSLPRHPLLDHRRWAGRGLDRHQERHRRRRHRHPTRKPEDRHVRHAAVYHRDRDGADRSPHADGEADSHAAEADRSHGEHDGQEAVHRGDLRTHSLRGGIPAVGHRDMRDDNREGAEASSHRHHRYRRHSAPHRGHCCLRPIPRRFRCPCHLCRPWNSSSEAKIAPLHFLPAFPTEEDRDGTRTAERRLRRRVHREKCAAAAADPRRAEGDSDVHEAAAVRGRIPAEHIRHRPTCDEGAVRSHSPAAVQEDDHEVAVHLPHRRWLRSPSAACPHPVRRSAAAISSPLLAWWYSYIGFACAILP